MVSANSGFEIDTSVDRINITGEAKPSLDVSEGRHDFARDFNQTEMFSDLNDDPVIDTATLSELDEINPLDSISQNNDFERAATLFNDTVGCGNTPQLKGIAFNNQLRECFATVKHAAQTEICRLIESTKKIDEDPDIDSEKIPRSFKFDLFSEELIKRCFGEVASNFFDDQNDQQILNKLQNVIFKQFLVKTQQEATYLLNEMDVVIKQLETNIVVADSDSRLNYNESHVDRSQSFNHTLLDINRTRNQDIHLNLSKQDLVYKLFNFSVFKLACIVERVRLYQIAIVQPRDNKLNVIEVNLETKSNILGDRFINIWQKNDFLLCYQVLQIIHKEIQRIEKKNVERSMFQELINCELGHKLTQRIQQSNRRRIEDPSMSNPVTERGILQNERRTIRNYFLGDNSFCYEAMKIYQDRWIYFTSETRKKQPRQQDNQLQQTMDKKVFLHFKTSFQKKALQPGEKRYFQLELIYQSEKAISQKVKFYQREMNDASNEGQTQEDKFLFLQVPFKLLLGCDVFMIIKVFTELKSKGANEHDYIWTKNRSKGAAETRNVHYIYEGYALVDISSAIWNRNIRCGQMFRHQVQFCKADSAQNVDTRYVQIYQELNFEKHSNLQSDHRPQVKFALYSDLSTYAQQISLPHTKIVMMKRFMATLYESRDFASASQFLKVSDNSHARSYTQDQLIDIDNQIKPFISTLNELKLEMHTLSLPNAANIKSSFVRLQVFIRMKDQGCQREMYDNLECMKQRKYSHQSLIAPVYKNIAVLHDTCFLKIPTRDQRVLKDLHIIVLIQLPILVSDFAVMKDEHGNQVHSDEIRRKIGLSSKGHITIDQIKRFPDLVTWRTAFIGEIPLYDQKEKRVVHALNPPMWLKFRRFNSNNFDIKQQNPISRLDEEPGVQLLCMIDVYSLHFSLENSLNKIITLYDTKPDLDDNDIRKILKHTKKITAETRNFHAEKLISNILNIFCKAKTRDGSTYAFEALLFLIQQFKSQNSVKKQKLLDQFITKRLENYEEQPIYPRLLFQMFRFTEWLEQSLAAGQALGTVKQHFTLFKELPTICSILKRSFELEERQITVHKKMEERNRDRQRTNAAMSRSIRQHEANNTGDTGTSFVDRVREQQKTLERAAIQEEEKRAAPNDRQTTTTAHQSMRVTTRESCELDLLDGRNRHNQSTYNRSLLDERSPSLPAQGEKRGVSMGCIQEDRNQISSQPQSKPINGSQPATGSSQADTAFQDHLHPIPEEEDEANQIDQLVANLDSRHEDQSIYGRRTNVESGIVQRKSHHPTKRLTIVGLEIEHPEQLLFKIQMQSEEFSQVIEIILQRMVRMLHKDIDKSCFTLRMIFYKNLNSVLDNIVTFLSQNVIQEIFGFLVRPLERLSDDHHLGIERSSIEQNMAQSSRGSLINAEGPAREPSIAMINLHNATSALRSEQALLQDNNQAPQNWRRGQQNVRGVRNYLTQRNFWASELAGQEEVNQIEFVRRIITMGQFLQSKAIEALKGNPSEGRRIADQFAQFISESSGDFSAHKKNSMFLHNISENLKAHSFLYILHQIFIHENRFAQQFDQNQNLYLSTGQNNELIPDAMHQMMSGFYRKNTSELVEDPDMSRASVAITEYDDQNELTNLTTKKKKQDRLDYFTKDSDYYTNLLLMIVKMQADEALPQEIVSTLEPVREKCQLIIFQLVTLLNRQTLSWFIKRKKQLRLLLQNIIELIMSDSLEFRAPFTLFGGEKKLRVFQKFTMHLAQELTCDRQYSNVLGYKETYRPILSSLWLIKLLIYVERLDETIKVINGPLSVEDYQKGTWNMFEQFEQFWTKFHQKKRMLIHTEGENEKVFQNTVIERMRKIMMKEAKHGSYNSCTALINLLFYYEQEYYKFNNDQKLDMLSQLVRICKVLNEASPVYSADFYKVIETDIDHDSVLFKMLQTAFEKFRLSDCAEYRKDFIEHLSEILNKFRTIERRILMLKIAERNYSKHLLYVGFCEYEQLKVFIRMDLDYISEFFSEPFNRYKKRLKEISDKMIPDDSDSDDNFIQDNLPKGLVKKQNLEKNTNTHFKTEIAFSHVKEHQIVESSCERGRLALGSDHIELTLRVQLMKTACNQLRFNRFFLMAIELKEKEKNLLMQSFAYGDDSGIKEDTNMNGQGSNKPMTHDVFDTLHDEKTIHKDIQKFRTSAKTFCCYFFLRFFGRDVPHELKDKQGFILRGLASQNTFQLMDDLRALYRERNIKFVDDQNSIPDENCEIFTILLQKIEPFTVQKRKKFRVSDKVKEISQTIASKRQRYPPEFKEYFEQNFRKQFYDTGRVVSQKLLKAFRNHAITLRPQLANEDDSMMTKEQTFKYYAQLHKSSYEKDVTLAEKEKMWTKLGKQKLLDEEQRVKAESLTEYVVTEWKNCTPMLHDLEVTIYEVEENFPTMYNMQKVIARLSSPISGVEQETLNWKKRVNKHIKVRQAVQQVFSVTQKGETNDTNQNIVYLKKVGPKLRNLWDEIRMDIDTDQNGGVLMTLEVFFPNKDQLNRVQELEEDKQQEFRKYLTLFVTIETWFQTIYSSLIMFEEKNRIYDEYQRMMNPHANLVMDNSVNWFNKYQHKRAIFDQYRKNCDIDTHLREEEEALQLEDSD